MSAGRPRRSRPAAAGAQRAAGRRARPRRRLAAESRRAALAGRQPASPAAPPRSRRPTPGTSSAASSRGWATGARCCSASSSTPTGAVRDLHLKGSGRDAVRARRRRPGRGRPDAARVRRQRGDARPGHPDHPLARGGGHRAPGAAGDAAARAPCSPAWPAATCGSGSFQYAAATGDVGLLRRLADHAIARHYPGAAEAENPYLALFEAVVAGPGVADGPMDARRVRPRRDEHRQHDDLRRDDRLRAVRLHGGLRPGHGVQLDRSLGALRLRQPARLAEWNLARFAETLLPLLADDVDEAVALARSRSVSSDASTTPRGRPACGPSSACRETSTTRSSRR